MNKRETALIEIANTMRNKNDSTWGLEKANKSNRSLSPVFLVSQKQGLETGITNDGME